VTLKNCLLARASLLTLLGSVQFIIAAPALAQDQEGPPAPVPPAAADQLGADEETIIVTGSRIRRDPLEQSSPVTVVDQSAIDRTGLSSVADVLQRLPSAGGALNSKFNNSGNFGNPPDGGGVGAGAAEVDLRYLGSRRTLVLVDGLRFVNGSSASGVPASVDLNAIPESMIERVEVLLDGASPIYGSDAIAGVVNIITKTRPEGFDVSAQVGAYDEGDGTTQKYDLSWGGGNDRTSIVVGASYVNQDPVSSADRKISLFPTPGATACDSSCSSGTPLGRFIVLDNDLTWKAPVLTSAPPRFDPLDPTGPNSDFKAFTDADRFNFAPFNFILTPQERFGGFVSFNQEFSDAINFNVKAIYNKRKSKNQAAPLPLFVGPDAGNGNLLDRISIDATNPFNPFGVTLESGFNLDGTPNGNTPNYNFIGRRFVENGPRRYAQDVDTWYITSTLDGSFDVGDRNWYWDVNGVLGYNDAHQVAHGNVNALNVARALGPIADCTGDCVPFNIFGGAGSITQEMIDYVAFTQRDRSDQRLMDASANVTGELFDLPGGPLGLAVGYEHRDHKGSFNPDPLVAAGFGSDIPAQATSGRFNVDEFYGELRAPVLKDLPFVNELELSFAARHSDYSTFGGTTTLKGGVMWKPIEDVLLRGSWAEGFRAPGIGELFGTPSRFDQELEDPCSDLLGLAGGTPASAAVAANCIAQGVPADGSYVQANPQLSVITGGNPDLAPEESESWVFGFVYSPTWARDSFASAFDIEANYYDVTVDGAIQPIGADVLLGRCAETLDAFSCAAVTRTASGAVAQISGLLQNIGSIKTRGIDLTLNFRTAETSAGSFGLYWTNNFLLEYTEIVPATVGTTAIEREGTERGSPDQAFPKYKATAVLDWLIGDFNASITGRYISGVLESQTVTDTDPGNRLGRRLYTDVQATWRPSFLDQRLGLTVGVNNIFDKDPPGCISCGLNNFDPTTYDVPGQFGYIRLTYKM
jgi:iron complex outermembrane receptor protein